MKKTSIVTKKAPTVGLVSLGCARALGIVL